MASTQSRLVPLEFRMTLEQKNHAKRMASEAGISLSELVRRAIESYECERKLAVISKKIRRIVARSRR